MSPLVIVDNPEIELPSVGLPGSPLLRRATPASGPDISIRKLTRAGLTRAAQLLCQSLSWALTLRRGDCSRPHPTAILTSAGVETDCDGVRRPHARFRIDLHRRGPKPDPCPHRTRSRVGGAGKLVELQFGSGQGLQRALLGAALEYAVADLTVNGVRVPAVGAQRAGIPSSGRVTAILTGVNDAPQHAALSEVDDPARYALIPTRVVP